MAVSNRCRFFSLHRPITCNVAAVISFIKTNEMKINWLRGYEIRAYHQHLRPILWIMSIDAIYFHLLDRRWKQTNEPDSLFIFCVTLTYTCPSLIYDDLLVRQIDRIYWNTLVSLLRSANSCHEEETWTEGRRNVFGEINLLSRVGVCVKKKA